jgi:hypothetical protein
LTLVLPGVATGDRGAVGALTTRTVSCAASGFGAYASAVPIAADVLAGVVVGGVVVDGAISAGSVVEVVITIDAGVDVGAFVVFVGVTVESVDAGGIGLDVDKLSGGAGVELASAPTPGGESSAVAPGGGSVATGSCGTPVSAWAAPAAPTATATEVATAATTMPRRTWSLRFTFCSLLFDRTQVAPGERSMTMEGRDGMSSDHSTCRALAMSNAAPEPWRL